MSEDFYVSVGDQVQFAKTVGESDVYLFAGITGDLSSNHVNEEVMKRSSYGRRIAHGALLIGFMSTTSTLMIERSGGVGAEETPVSLGYDRIRFLAPVFIGDTVSVTYRIAEVDPARRRSRSEIEIRNQARVHLWYPRRFGAPYPQLASAEDGIGRFLAQPRLRLAWLIAFGRSAWWGHFFTFAPLYMVTRGYGEIAAALVISLGNAMLFLNLAIGRFAARFGVRLVIVAAFGTAGAASLAAALLVDWPPAAVIFLLAGALGCSALDAVGNIPFLRSVRAHERPQMTTVFRTYLDMSDLLPPALFALLLSFFGLASVFCAAGLWMLAIGLTARLLPRGF